MPKVTSGSAIPELPEAPDGPAATPQVRETLEPRPTDTLERAPDQGSRELLLGDPYADARVHSSYYAALPGALDTALDALAARYPEVERKFAARFLEVALSAGAQVPAMTYSHEAGHFREAARQGADPQIQMLGWMSGVTTYRYADKAPDATAQATVAAAGVNQEQVNAAVLYQGWARRGGTSYVEAMGYLLAQTNLALYASMTAVYEKRGVRVADSNDIRAYLNALQKNGQSITSGQLAAMALAIDLASAPVWASLLGQLRYLANGQGEVPMPSVSLGELKASFPNTHLLLTPQGPVLGANVMVQGAGAPLELSLDVRTDLKAAAVGAKMLDAKIADGVAVSPFLRATVADGRPGVLVGAEVRAWIQDGAELTASVAYRHGDLLTSAEGATDGVTAHVGVAIRF